MYTVIINYPDNIIKEVKVDNIYNFFVLLKELSSKSDLKFNENNFYKQIKDGEVVKFRWYPEDADTVFHSFIYISADKQYVEDVINNNINVHLENARWGMKIRTDLNTKYAS